jgi:Uma2 family endonuclease
LPHENKLIEVKSTWTYKTDWDKKLKYQQQSCKDQGYAYEIWIYNQKGLKINVI